MQSFECTLVALRAPVTRMTVLGNTLLVPASVARVGDELLAHLMFALKLRFRTGYAPVRPILDRQI